MESVLVDGAASQPPISNTLWRMLTGGYEHTYILQLPNDSRDRRELIDRACHNWRRICAEIGNSAVASAVSPQTAQAPQQAAPKAAPWEWTEQDALGILNQLSDGPFGQGDVDDALDFMRLVDTARRDKAAPGEPDPADIIAGALQISRGHAIEMMREALEAAPQQEAQTPVAWYEYNADLDAWFLAYRRNPKAKTRPLVFGDTAPQPAPAPLSDDVVRDAARWRWLSEHIGVAWNEGKFTSLVRIVSDKNRTALNASIDRMMTGDWSDAALAAQERQP